MGQSAVALRYAEALYALAREHHRTTEVLRDLAAVKAALDGDPPAWARVLHPRVEPKAKDAFLRERFLAGKDPLVVNLVRLLVRRRREGLLRDFFRAYLEVHEVHEGILRVEVETPRPLVAATREALRAKLAAATGKQVVLEDRAVPELLGGMRLIVGSRLIDGSIRSRLERIQRGLRSVPIAQT